MANFRQSFCMSKISSSLETLERLGQRLVNLHAFLVENPKQIVCISYEITSIETHPYPMKWLKNEFVWLLLLLCHFEQQESSVIHSWSVVQLRRLFVEGKSSLVILLARPNSLLEAQGKVVQSPRTSTWLCSLPKQSYSLFLIVQHIVSVSPKEVQR